MKLLNALKSATPAAILGCLALGLTPTSAIATTATTTFGVTATVQDACMVSATAMAFGNYTAVVATTTSTVSVTCTNGTHWNVGLSAGLGTDATDTARKMTGPAGALLSYGLFSDNAWSANWGAPGGTGTQAGTGSGSAQALTVYGQVPAGQYVATGAYADTITATVTY